VLFDSRRGEIVLEIIAAAKESGAAAIVVGKRGTVQISALLLGSVSQ
jgi:nucleotide-binding universal stress UspA family protein